MAKDRVTTLVIKTESVLPDWLTRAHTEKDGENGIIVKKLYCGDQLSFLSKLQALIGKYDEELSDEFIEELKELEEQNDEDMLR